MKAKHGAPHLEKLRYDYQLLHDAYSMESPRHAKLASWLVVAGIIGWIITGILWGIL
jgi:tetrahydromethanopterin S-methyltransferase subunit F